MTMDSQVSRRWLTSCAISAAIVGVAMVWTGESPTRWFIQEGLSWLMLPGILVGFAIGNYGGHDFQWPYLIGVIFNFAFYTVLAFGALSVRTWWRKRKHVKA